jgi:hypothetical protein
MRQPRLRGGRDLTLTQAWSLAVGAPRLELVEGFVGPVLPFDPEDLPVVPTRLTGGPTASAPLELPRAWMRTRAKTRLPRSYTCSSSIVAARPAPSKKFSKTVRIPARPRRVPPSIASSGLTHSISGWIRSLSSAITSSTDSLRLTTSLQRRTISSPGPATRQSMPASASAWLRQRGQSRVSSTTPCPFTNPEDAFLGSVWGP